MRDTRARQLLVAEARRLGYLHHAITDEITATHTDTDTPPASDTRGPAAAATTLEHEVEESLRIAVEDERAEVAFALARLDTGTYGTCIACGHPIPDDRLEIVPATRFCISCETIGERDTTTVAMPMIDAIIRAALREIDSWDDDGPDEDDHITPAPEDNAMHTTPAPGRT